MTGWEALRCLLVLERLTHVVQSGTKRNHGMKAGPILWETIAAFDNGLVAENYAKACRETGNADEYRVCDVDPSNPAL